MAPGEESQSQESQILQAQLTAGQAALRRSATGLIISAFSGGLDLGFSLFLSAAVLTVLPGSDWSLLQRLLVGGAYAVGFILVVIGRSELFTEQTTLAVLPVLHGISGIGRLARLWGIVWVGNVVAEAVFAVIAVIVGPALGAIDPAAFDAIAQRTLAPDWWVIILSAALAGWLMGMLSWLGAATDDTLARMAIVVVITASIGFLGLHHSIVGTSEVLAGVLAGGNATMADFARFLALATFGNAVGGTFFVAVLKYGHAVRPGQKEEVEVPGDGPGS